MKRKSLLSIVLLLLIQPSFAQIKDTLLGFVGKWKDKKTFIADSNIYGGGAGASVTVSPNGNFIINTPQNKTWNDHIDNQVSDIDKEAQDIKDNFRSAEAMVQYHLAKECIYELEKTKEQIKTYKTLTDEQQQSDQDVLKIALKNFKENLQSECEKQLQNYNDISAFYNEAHTKEKRSKNYHYNLPEPPVADYSCWECDTAKQNAYNKAVHIYDSIFFAEENAMLKKAFSIERFLLLTRESTFAEDGAQQIVDEAFSESRKNPVNGPCYNLANKAGNVSAIIDFLVNRMLQRAQQLFYENKKNKNYAVITPVTEVYLTAFKVAELLGIANDADLEELAAYMEAFYDQQKKKLVQEKDYSQIANIPFLIGILRQQLVLGSKRNAEAEAFELFDFCRNFKLTIDMDIKVGKNNGYMLAHLKGEAKVVAEWDSARCVKFNLDQGEQAFMKLDIINNELVPKEGTYVGVRKAQIPMPSIVIHFCKSGTDSFYVERFAPYQNGSMMWNYPGAPPVAGWINRLDDFFSDNSQTLAEAKELKKDPQQIANTKQQAAEMQKKLIAMRQSGASPQQMAAEAKQMMETTSQFTTMPVLQLGELKFLIHYHAGSDTLISERIDAKQINPKEAKVIVYGYYTIKLEHNSKAKKI